MFNYQMPFTSCIMVSKRLFILVLKVSAVWNTSTAHYQLFFNTLSFLSMTSRLYLEQILALESILKQHFSREKDPCLPAAH